MIFREYYSQPASYDHPLNDGLIPNEVPEQLRRWAEQAANPTAQQRQGRRSSRLMVQTMVYEWSSPVTVDEIQLYWFNYDGLAKLPQAQRLSYWDGAAFVPVNNPVGFGLRNDTYNTTTFDPITTTRMRLELDSVGYYPSVLLEWKVLKAANAPEVAPLVMAGIDRDVMVGGKTYLSGLIKAVDPIKNTRWTAKGPGSVTFANPSELVTTATVSAPGDYVLTLTSQSGTTTGSSSLNLTAHFPPKEKRLDVVYTKRYTINSPLWNNRAKALITSWIPWCIDQCERTDLTTGQGGLDNFIESLRVIATKGRMVRIIAGMAILSDAFSATRKHLTVNFSPVARLTQ
ncbi:MAG: hypothetical protein BWY72_02333 [Bacteroidetes bacterium ADurb.Bin416]|nr:MAG: hypothetical protein BWY72_02333 [Bacteroidetes bacterium ADurb.Bin416]